MSITKIAASFVLAASVLGISGCKLADIRDDAGFVSQAPVTMKLQNPTA